jgi:PAS domain S-box-containing protein
MTRSRKPSVAMLAAATLVTVTTLLLAVFGTVDCLNRYDSEWSRLRRVTRAQTNELAAALAVSVWNIDRAQIEKILDSQAEVQAIEAIVVVAAGKTHARVRDPQRRFVPAAAFASSPELLTEESPITFEGETIGSVRVYTTPMFIREQLRSAVIRTVLSIFVVDVLVVVSVYLVLWRILLRPLREIERYASNLQAGGDAPVSTGPAAELENLRVSIETMVRLLDQRFIALKEQMARGAESEERFRTIFDSANDAIFIHDAEGTILNANARACEMFGYSRDELLTLEIGNIGSGIEPYTTEGGAARIREALTGSQKIFEWHARQRNGRLFWTEISIRVAKIDGTPRAIVIVRDVEQRKEMERELRRRETMAAMGTLVAGVAHEVRNPLFGMTALLDAYAEALSTPDLAEMSASLREQVTRLTHVTRELLEYGTPVNITLVPDSLRELIDEAVAGRAAVALNAGVTLRNEIERGLPPTPMDRTRMRQVFDNLIDNALQHTPARKSITIAAREVQQDERSWIECTVNDEGQGFFIDDLEHVFEPFFTRRERGIGLGMSVVQRIVEEHAGRVSVGNRPEGGAVITVRLPVVS